MITKRSLLASTASVTAFTLALGGYGRGAYAGTCIGSGGTYECLGEAVPAYDSTITINADVGGPVSITSTDSFGLLVPYSDAMQITTSGSTTDLTVDLEGDIYGKRSGITIDHSGSGALDVAIEESSSSAGIGLAITGADNSDIAVDINAVSAAAGDAVSITSGNNSDVSLILNTADSTSGRGVYVNQQGSGDISVVASGTVNAGGNAIEVNADATSPYGDGVSILTRDVRSIGGSGIVTDIAPDGSATISVDGTLDASRNGIEVFRRGAGDVLIEFDDMTAGDTGVSVFEAAAAPGTLQIIGDGTLSAGASGIDVEHGGDVEVSMKTVEYQADGIDVEANGLIRISVSGDVTNTATTPTRYGSGIRAFSDGPGYAGVFVGGDMTVAGTALVISADDDVLIDVRGDITSGYQGIYASSENDSVDIFVQGVTARDGSAIRASAAFDSTIEANGPLHATQSGISVRIDDETALDIRVQDITVEDTGTYSPVSGCSACTDPFGVGIFVSGTPSDGSVNIGVSGAVRTFGDSIWVQPDGFQVSRIEIAETGSLESIGGYSIRDEGAATLVTLAGVIVSGDVHLGDGDDAFRIFGSNAAIGSSVRLDGGEGYNRLGFTTAVGALDGNRLSNFDYISVENSRVQLSGRLTAYAMYVDGGSIVTVDGNAQQYGYVQSDGLIDLRDGAAHDSLTVLGHFGGAGAVGLDVDGSDAQTADRLIVGGIAGYGSDTTSLHIQVTGASGATTGASEFVLVERGAFITDTAFELEDGPVDIGALQFDLDRNDGGDVILASSGVSGAAVGFSAIGAGATQGALGMLGAMPGGVSQNAPGPEVARGPVAVAPPARTGWLEFFGARGVLSYDTSIAGFSDNGDTHLNSRGMRFGVDLPFRTSGAGQWTGSVSFSAMEADQTIRDSGDNRIGSVTTTSKALILGLDYRNFEYFAAGQLGLGRSELDITPAGGGNSRTDARTAMLALRAGRSRTLADGATLSFGGGIDLVRSQFDDFTDSSGSRVSMGEQTLSQVSLETDYVKPFALGGGTLYLSGGAEIAKTLGGESEMEIAGQTVEIAGSDAARLGFEFGLDWLADNGQSGFGLDLAHSKALGDADYVSSAGMTFTLRF